MRVSGHDITVIRTKTPEERMQYVGDIEETLEEQLARLAAIVRQNPVPIVLGAFGVGLLFGILLRGR